MNNEVSAQTESGSSRLAHALTPALRVIGLTKSFGPVEALRGVDLELHRGEVLGLLGDNGAGKTTLVNCLSGAIEPDSGTIEVGGAPVRLGSPQQARALGIEAVHQDLALVGSLDVASNLFLHRELTRRWRPARALGLLDKPAMARRARQILGDLRINIPSVNESVERLSGGQRQAVAVGRAAAWGRDIVLMDEPAAALGVEQSKKVLGLIGTLADNGIAVLLISHNMQHVMGVCHRVVVLRHGEKVGDELIRHVTSRDLVDLITGSVTGTRASVTMGQPCADHPEDEA